MVARDIDLEVVCERPSIAPCFRVAASLAELPAVPHVRFANDLAGPNQALYVQVRCTDAAGAAWKLDAWVRAADHPGPLSRTLREAMRRVLTPEARAAILALKEELTARPGPPVSGIAIYRAVLDGGVRTAGEMADWLRREPPGPPLSWVPTRVAPPRGAATPGPRGPVVVAPVTEASLGEAAELFGAYLAAGGPPVSSAEGLARLARFRGCPGASVQLARVGGRAAGFASLGPGASGSTGRPVLVVAALYVRPELRRRGVATALLRRACDIAAEQGANRVELSTDTANRAARALYEGVGFAWLPAKEVYMRFL
jgi:GNAT superfamily N-acetyltransferase